MYKLSAEENIRRVAFIEGGILYGEFDKIFSDLFSSRNELYKNIVKALASGPKTQGEIAQLLNYSHQSEVGEYLDILEKSGFISRDFTWNINKASE